MEMRQSDKAKWQVQQSLREEALSTIIYPSLRRKIWGLTERQSRPPNDSTQTALVDSEDLALRNGQGHAYPSAGVRGRHIWWNQLLPAQLLLSHSPFLKFGRMAVLRNYFYLIPDGTLSLNSANFSLH